MLEEDAASQLAELLEQQNLEWVGRHRHHHRPGAVERPVELLAHRSTSARAATTASKVDMPVVNGAGLVGRIVQVTPSRSTVQLITDPDFLVGRPAARQRPGHRHRPRPGPGRGPPRRHPPRARHRRPAQARHRAHHQRRAAQRLPRLDPGRARCAPCARRAAASPSSWSCGRWPTPSGCSSSPCSSGSRRVIPPSPLTVAVRTSFVLVTALTLQLGVLAGFALFGVQADLHAARRHRRRASPPAPIEARPSASPPGSPTTCMLQTPVRAVGPHLRDRRLPGRQPPGLGAPRRVVDPRRHRDRGEHASVSSSTACSARCSARTSSAGSSLRIAADRRPAQHGRRAPVVVRAMRWATGSVNSVRARAVYR